jgi:hypothetical protein
VNESADISLSGFRSDIAGRVPVSPCIGGAGTDAGDREIAVGNCETGGNMLPERAPPPHPVTIVASNVKSTER